LKIRKRTGFSRIEMLACQPKPWRRQTKSGFSLVEVLVALALAGVVTALAVLILHTTRQVTSELQTPLTSPTDALRLQLQEDLDHLLPGEILPNEPPLMLREEGILQMVSLRSDERGIPHPTRIRYDLDDSTLRRITTGGTPPTSSTNLVLRSVKTFIPTAFLKGEPRTEWPDEQKEALPQRVEVAIQPTGSAPAFTFSLDIPASFSLKPAEKD
jgi:prepilin-type N-terminal cleavage/methylation domain-containing protein